MKTQRGQGNFGRTFRILIGRDDSIVPVELLRELIAHGPKRELAHPDESHDGPIGDIDICGPCPHTGEMFHRIWAGPALGWVQPFADTGRDDGCWNHDLELFDADCRDALQ